MSPIALSLNLLLAALLCAALTVGWRLERRLKALRNGHEGFAAAVADLDRAARRAEMGLAELRNATDEALELLVSRIDKAREMAARLDHLTTQGASLAGRAPRPAAPAASAPPPIAHVRVRPVVATLSETEAKAAAEHLVLRLSGHDQVSSRKPSWAPAPARPVPEARPRFVDPPRRSRAAVDDDLFDAPTASGRLASGGRS